MRHVKKFIFLSLQILKNKGFIAYIKLLYGYIIFGTDYLGRESVKNLGQKIDKIKEPAYGCQTAGEFRKFYFTDSSKTWYGIARQLERCLIRLGYIPDEKGTTICFANDIGEIDPVSLKKIDPSNRITLKRAVDSKAEFLFYSQKSCKKWFEKRKNSYYLPSGVDTDIFKIYPEIIRNIDVGFVGKNYGNPIRNDFLSKLSELEGSVNVAMPPENYLFFEKLSRFYNRCKIVVNDSQQNEVTMRMFEATACGCLLITRKVPFIQELFEPGEEIILYENFDEMKDKILYYLKNEQESQRIAQKGTQKTHMVHSYRDRAKFIANKIRGERKADYMEDAKIYKKFYEAYTKSMPLAQERLFDESLPDTNIRWNIRERMRKTVQFCYGDILDVGTQRGGYLFHAKKRPQVGRLVGIDISEEYIKDAKNIQPEIEFIVGKIEALPFSDQSFDTVMATEILEHIPDLESGIREIKRVMKKSGQLLISVPDYDFKEDPYHVRNFTRFDFTQLFEGMRVDFIQLENCSNILVRITNR